MYVQCTCVVWSLLCPKNVALHAGVFIGINYHSITAKVLHQTFEFAAQYYSYFHRFVNLWGL